SEASLSTTPQLSTGTRPHTRLARIATMSCSLVVGFVHANCGEDAGGGGEAGDKGGGGADAVGVGEDAGQECAGGEAAVAPEAVDADGAGPPGGVGDVADGGEQSGVHQRGTDAEQDGGHRPWGECGGGGGPGQGGGL